jgi:hypothetical protein
LHCIIHLVWIVIVGVCFVFTKHALHCHCF